MTYPTQNKDNSILKVLTAELWGPTGSSSFLQHLPKQGPRAGSTHTVPRAPVLPGVGMLHVIYSQRSQGCYTLTGKQTRSG